MNRRYSGVPKVDTKRLLLSEEHKSLSSRKELAEQVMISNIRFVKCFELTVVTGTVGCARFKRHLETKARRTTKA